MTTFHIGDKVFIREANSWGRNHLPDGPIEVTITDIDRRSQAFSATSGKPGDSGWNYMYSEVFIPEALPRKRGTFIGGKRVAQLPK